MNAKDPRPFEELDHRRRQKGIKETGFRVNERTYRKFIAGTPLSDQTTTVVLSDPEQGLGIRDVRTIDYYLIATGHPRLTLQEIRRYGLEADAERMSETPSTLARPPLGGSLVAYYPLTGSTKDLGRRGNHARAIGDVHFGLQGERRGARLKGKNSCIFVRHARSLYLSQFTLCAWIYPGEISGRRRIIEKGDSDGYWLFLHNDCPLVGFRYCDRHINLLASTALRPKTWHFIAGTFDGRFLALFLDGEEDGRREVPAGAKPMSTREPLIIGWKHEGISLDRFSGLLSDVRVYNVALTTQELKALYFYDPYLRRKPVETTPTN